jgi:translocator protein
MKRAKNFLQFLFSIGICFLTGYIGAFFTSKNISPWYETLNKPAFNPPDWTFSLVWSILYFLMGLSLYLIIRNSEDLELKITAFATFFLQLILNILWSFVFFGNHAIYGGLVVLALLWFCVLMTILKFKEISKLSGLLLVPYLIWLSYAGVLNYFIWQLNLKS